MIHVTGRDGLLLLLLVLVQCTVYSLHGPFLAVTVSRCLGESYLVVAPIALALKHRLMLLSLYGAGCKKIHYGENCRQVIAFMFLYIMIMIT